MNGDFVSLLVLLSLELFTTKTTTILWQFSTSFAKMTSQGICPRVMSSAFVTTKWIVVVDARRISPIICNNDKRKKIMLFTFVYRSLPSPWRCLFNHCRLIRSSIFLFIIQLTSYNLL